MKRIPAKQRDTFLARESALRVSIHDFVYDFQHGMGVPYGEGELFKSTIDTLISRLEVMRAHLQVQPR